MLSTFSSLSPTRDFQRLYLAADCSIQERLEHVLQGAIGHLQQWDNPAALDEPFLGVFSVQCDSDSLRQLGNLLQDELDRDELDRIAYRISHSTKEASTSELMNSSPLSCLVDTLDGQWIRDLIDRDRLVTYYQPIVNTLDPADIFGYECLTRGSADDGGIIAPFLMFSRARRAGMLDQLDYAAFLKSVESIGKLNSGSRFLLNVCPAVASGARKAFREMLEAATQTLSENNQIVIEITESERIENDEMLLEVLDDFRASGVRLALDDVGSGYSSLSLLAELQPELIKVDMSLVRGASQDPYRGCIVRKLIELAKELEIKTVVEGVETLDDWNWVQDEGADYAQGFLFARPAGVLVDPATIITNTQTTFAR